MNGNLFGGLAQGFQQGMQMTRQIQEGNRKRRLRDAYGEVLPALTGSNITPEEAEESFGGSLPDIEEMIDSGLKAEYGEDAEFVGFESGEDGAESAVRYRVGDGETQLVRLNGRAGRDLLTLPNDADTGTPNADALRTIASEDPQGFLELQNTIRQRRRQRQARELQATSLERAAGLSEPSNVTADDLVNTPDRFAIDRGSVGQNGAPSLEAAQNMPRNRQSGAQASPAAPMPETPEGQSLDWQTPEQGRQFERMFQEAGERNGVPPELLSRVAFQESGYDANAVGDAGEVGLMQIMPSAHPDAPVGSRTKGGYQNADPKAEIEYAAQYLSRLRDRYGGDWEKALVAYNQGPTSLDENGAVPAAAEYSQDVLSDLPSLDQATAGSSRARASSGRARPETSTPNQRRGSQQQQQAGDVPFARVRTEDGPVSLLSVIGQGVEDLASRISLDGGLQSRVESNREQTERNREEYGQPEDRQSQQQPEQPRDSRRQNPRQAQTESGSFTFNANAGRSGDGQSSDAQGDTGRVNFELPTQQQIDRTRARAQRQIRAGQASNEFSRDVIDGVRNGIVSYEQGQQMLGLGSKEYFKPVQAEDGGWVMFAKDGSGMKRFGAGGGVQDEGSNELVKRMVNVFDSFGWQDEDPRRQNIVSALSQLQSTGEFGTDTEALPRVMDLMESNVRQMQAQGLFDFKGVDSDDVNASHYVDAYRAANLGLDAREYREDFKQTLANNVDGTGVSPDAVSQKMVRVVQQALRSNSGASREAILKDAREALSNPRTIQEFMRADEATLIKTLTAN